MTLPVPRSIFLQNTLALGKTRSGKSTALRLVVEHMLAHEERVCVIDPKGDWYGLKSSGDGKHPGFAVVIFGGEHADVPINEHSGAAVAELVATGNRPSLIDLGGWTVKARTRFFVNFAAALFKLNRAPMTLCIDEVHNFCPQNPMKGDEAGAQPMMIHWANRLASEGSGKGIILLAASQRPQKVSKDFVTCFEGLMAFRVIHPLDRKAIKEWIDGCPDPEKGKEVLESLAQLERGEAWVWSPEPVAPAKVGFGPVRVKFPKFKTFDSFAAPTGDGPAKLKGWAEVNLDEVRAKLADVVQEQEANDPKKLKAKVAELERALERSVKSPLGEMQALASIAEADAEIVRWKRTASSHEALLVKMGKWMDAQKGRIEAAHSLLSHAVDDPMPEIPKPEAVRAEATRAPVATASTAGRPAARVVVRDGELGRMPRALLTALAQRGEMPKGELLLHAGYAASGKVSAAFAMLSERGYMESNGSTVKITREGFNTLGPYDPLPSGHELRQQTLRDLTTLQAALLQAWFDVYPNGRTKQQVLEAANYAASGKVSAAFALLTGRRFIVKHGAEYKAAKEFFA